MSLPLDRKGRARVTSIARGGCLWIKTDLSMYVTMIITGFKYFEH